MLFNVFLTVNQTRVHVRPYGLQNSDYINASFVEVRRGQSFKLKNISTVYSKKKD